MSKDDGSFPLSRKMFDSHKVWCRVFKNGHSIVYYLYLDETNAQKHLLENIPKCLVPIDLYQCYVSTLIYLILSKDGVKLGLCHEPPQPIPK